MKITVKNFKPKSRINMAIIDNDAESFINRDPVPPPRYELVKYKNSITDIKLLFGIWNGYKLSEMIDDYDGRRYITTFLLGPDSNFPKEFVSAVKEVLENRGFE